MANYYVIGNTAAVPDLTGTEYEGYKVVTANQISSTADSTFGMQDNDTVVISGSVDTHVTLQPSGTASDGFKLNVKIHDNTNTFNVDVGDAVNAAEPNVTVDVVGSSGNVSIGSADNMETLTVNLADGSSIGNITGGEEADDALIVKAGNNVTIGDITSYSGSESSDSVTVGDNSTVGDVTLGSGADSFTTGAGTTTGTLNAGDGDDTITIGGTTTNINVGGGATNLTVTSTGTIGDLDLGGEDDTVVIDGKAGYIQGSAGSDTITVNGTATGVEGDTDPDVITINGKLVKADGSAGTVYGGNGDDTINLGDGARVGDVSFGYSGPNGDRLNAGDNVLIDGWVTQAVGDEHSSSTVGDNLTVTGGFELHGGDDSLTIGEKASIGSQILTGEFGSVSDDDYLSIGAGSVVEGAIETDIGDDTVRIGDNTTLNGGPTPLYTYLGDDRIYLGSNIVLQPGAEISTGGGWDTVRAMGRNNTTSYTVDTGTLAPDGDRLVVAYSSETEKEALKQALADQGWTVGKNGIYTHPDSWNAAFVWEGVAYNNLWQVKSVPCFARGTMIRTDRGDVAIENLSAGDLVQTVDHDLQAIRWIGSRLIPAETLTKQENLRPIRIRAGALGLNSPESDLIVSPQHRVLVRSKIAQRIFGTDEVLVAAKQLLQIEGIDIATDMAEVEYFHMLFDQHEVVFSNGAETESLYIGPEALKSVGQAAREEIFTIFPQLQYPDYSPSAARLLVSGRSGRNLAMRHQKNDKALTEARLGHDEKQSGHNWGRWIDPAGPV